MLRSNGRGQGWVALIGLALAVTALVMPAEGKERGAQPLRRHLFPVDKADLTDRGRNPYFVLEPGLRLYLENGNERLVVSVIDDTQVVDGVKTRVVEERETKSGQLVEVSRNFFAISKKTGGVYYFGEDVDTYANGKVTGHDGAWRAGVKGAKFGLMVPGKPTVGQRYQQEVAPRVAMDRAEIVSVTTTFQTPAGSFKNCLRTRESSGLEGGSEEKLYAPGVGLIKDDKLVLVRVEKPRP